jgi:hypothetical protein
MRASDREIRESVAATWLTILRERHPGVRWVIVDEGRRREVPAALAGQVNLGAASADEGAAATGSPELRRRTKTHSIAEPR